MNKKTKNIGALNGKLLVFGGVYSNFQALEALQKIAEKEQIPPSNILCTGDIVAYCAEPEHCVQTVKNWGIHSILGNVEIQLRDDLDDCGCNFNDGSRCDIFSRQWYPYAQSKISQASKDWFHTLPDHLEFEYAGKKCLVVHGSYFETSGYVFKSTDWTKKQRNFEAVKTDVIIGGHCGLPFSDVQNTQYWLNAGVIGMPANDGTTRVWYMILEDKPFSFQHHAYEYDYLTTYQLMTNHCLPHQYAKTLKTGLWDNCEILPEAETAQQGQKLEFYK
jgi:predicted phosphodiesterase